MTKEDVFRQWVGKAEDDLLSARLLFGSKRTRVYDQVCFHCQQGAEKYLKALLSFRGIAFGKTHDLRQLARFLPSAESARFNATELDTLSAQAVSARYPGLAPVSNAGDAKRALAAAGKARAAAGGRHGAVTAPRPSLYKTL